jgi:hypothetical protein
VPSFFKKGVYDVYQPNNQPRNVAGNYHPGMFRFLTMKSVSSRKIENQKAIKAALDGNKFIVLLVQKQLTTDNPKPSDINELRGGKSGV